MHIGHTNRDDAPFARTHRRFANPTPFGFFALAISIFTVSLVNFGARGTSTATFLAAPAIWVGGVGQVLAGKLSGGGATRWSGIRQSGWLTDPRLSCRRGTGMWEVSVMLPMY